MKRARIILSGEVSRALTFKGVKLQRCKQAIEVAGGSVEEYLRQGSQYLVLAFPLNPFTFV